MALYLVVHDPTPEAEERVRPPTRLRELADAARQADASPRWIKAWSPDLHDDRIFTMWEATSAEAITAALEEFGFLDDYQAKPFRVREWGPDDVLTGDD
ncbi:MAG: hypothetical protein KC442_15060 [Thermomicrobiales bacterium]|nr:hypothetical protein [Thermomicrobiales bacterium]